MQVFKWYNSLNMILCYLDMDRIAIDIVLLPTERFIDEVIELNRAIDNTPEIQQIVLSKKDCVPHISLCMGCLKYEDLDKAKEIVNEVTQGKYDNLRFEVVEIQTKVISTGQKITGITVRNNRDLQGLHEDLMKGMWDLLSYDASPSMFVDPSDVDDITIQWLNGYAHKYINPSTFNPHITVGLGELKNNYFSPAFGVSQIALFQLGNYCTCRKLMFSFQL